MDYDMEGLRLLVKPTFKNNHVRNVKQWSVWEKNHDKGYHVLASLHLDSQFLVEMGMYITSTPNRKFFVLFLILSYLT